MIQNSESQVVSELAPVAVILVNWRNASDTLACIESLLLMDIVPALIVVCDNNSEDGSSERFREWNTECGADFDETRCKAFSKPKQCRARIVPEKCIVDGDFSGHISVLKKTLLDKTKPAVLFINHNRNDGFAAGCNIGLRAAQRLFKPEWLWFLNNDTIVDSFAMSALLIKGLSSPTYGLIGARIMYFDNPDRLQYAGGASVNDWFATVRPLDIPDLLSTAEAVVESKMNYVVGASMFASNAFIDEIGEIDERYFLYYEELDWAVRSGDRYRMGYASDAVIYHREGASIGGKTNGNQLKSRTAEYYATRSRIFFTLRHRCYFLPTVLMAILGGIVKRLLSRRFANAKYVFSGLVDGFKINFRQETS